MENKVKLNAAFRKKWIKALRSGKYKQIVDQLAGQGKGEYCVLGLGAKLLGATKKDMIKQGAGDPDEVLSEEVIECSGIGDVNYLMKYNDRPNDRWDFKKMADYLEENTVPK